MGKLLYRVAEAAEILAISSRQVYALMKKGELKGHNRNGKGKGLRVTGDSIVAYATKHETQTPAADK